MMEEAVRRQTEASKPAMMARAKTGGDAGKVERRHTVHQNDMGLKDAMRAMIEDDSDDMMDGMGSSFLQERGADSYVRDSAESLSAALGPRWDSTDLENTADRNTKALLHGIANPSALHGLMQLR